MNLSEHIVANRHRADRDPARIVCADGFVISVQAHRGAYCTPKDDLGPWSEVEVAFPGGGESKLPRDFKLYAEEGPTGVFPYVPTRIMETLIRRHGGFSEELTAEHGRECQASLAARRAAITDPVAEAALAADAAARPIIVRQGREDLCQLWVHQLGPLTIEDRWSRLCSLVRSVQEELGGAESSFPTITSMPDDYLALYGRNPNIATAELIEMVRFRREDPTLSSARAVRHGSPLSPDQAAFMMQVYERLEREMPGVFLEEMRSVPRTVTLKYPGEYVRVYFDTGVETADAGEVLTDGTDFAIGDAYLPVKGELFGRQFTAEEIATIYDASLRGKGRHLTAEMPVFDFPELRLPTMRVSIAPRSGELYTLPLLEAHEAVGEEASAGQDAQGVTPPPESPQSDETAPVEAAPARPRGRGR